MSADQWEVIFETGGEFQAEILGAMLEAENIPYFLSQEGAGRVYALTIGRLGRVQVLVPQEIADRAREVVRMFQIGQPVEDEPMMDYPLTDDSLEDPTLSDPEDQG